MELKIYVVIQKNKYKKYNFFIPKILFSNDLKPCKINIFNSVSWYFNECSLTLYGSDRIRHGGRYTRNKPQFNTNKC